MIKIIVAGAFGKMGEEVCKLIEREEQFQLVAIIDRRGRSREEVPTFTHFTEAIKTISADVLIDFTNPQAVFETITSCIEYGVRPVVGTTGLTTQDIEKLRKLCEDKKIGAVIAPNFAIGAILMMRFAQLAAKHMQHVEIIEFHHDQKLDAPSGTAVKTAELIAEHRAQLVQGNPNEQELISGARGGDYAGFRIHSVRLPGFVAHQEVIFGDEGQVLTIRHDSLQRSSFMPGVRLAVQQVMKLDQLIYGLEHLIE